MRLGLVVNPVTAEEEAAAFLDAARAAGHDVEVFETTAEDAGVSQARRAVEGGAEIVLACGGDGTVRAVAEGLLGSDVPLGVVPAGTGNLLSLNFDLPDDPDETLAAIEAGTVERVDTGELNGEVFVVMAGGGFDATVMEETAREDKERLGSLAYFLEGARHVRDDSVDVSIRNGSTPLVETSVLTVLVGNLGRLQGGVELFPESVPDDGLLDLLSIGGEGIGERLRAGIDALIGNNSEYVVRAQSSEFTVEFGRPTRYQLDGEPREPTVQLHFSTHPKSLSLVVPPGRKK